MLSSPRRYPSSIARGRPAQLFDLAAVSLLPQPTLLGGPCRLGLAPYLGASGGPANQSGQAFQGILAIAVLRAEALRLDNQLALLCYAIAGQSHEPRADIVWQGS
jgi:hypothetical protein